MPEQIRKQNSGKPWLALAVLTLGIASTVAIWHRIKSHETQNMEVATKLAAQVVRADIATDMEWQVFGLDRLGLLWEAGDAPAPLWTKNADLYLQHRPGSIAVEWLSADCKTRFLVSKGNGDNSRPLAFEGVPRQLIEAAEKSRKALVSAPVSVPHGRRQWAIAYPVYEGGHAQGFIVAFFDFEQSLDYILSDLRDLGFGLSVVQPNQQEYLLPGSDRRHKQEWSTTTNVTLPGGTWEVRVWPNPSVVARIRSWLPEATLILGAILSLLIALIVHLLNSVMRKSAYIRKVNERLQQETTELAQAQQELVQAHNELEIRVQRRTAELAAANDLLECEIREHQRAENSLRELTGRLFRLQDEERRRLARELHDGATQDLVALAMNMAICRESARDERTSQTLRECTKLIEECTTELRTISHLLHPPMFEELGLVPALQSYVDGFSSRSGIQVSVEIEPHLGRLGREIELNIFRIVQEALANVHRHARSRTATVLLFRNSGDLRLEIVDEGKGIPPERLKQAQAGLVGVGIAGMYERLRLLGGRLEITSDNNGTCISAQVPLASAAVGQAETEAA